MLLDMIYPPECPSCRTPVETMHNLCSECFAKLRLITKPMCACCGIPFVVPTGEDGQCPECLNDPPAFDRARSVMVYDGISAPLIHALKFQDQWAGLERYTAMLCATGKELLVQADIIVPIPLHWRRLWRRRQLKQRWADTVAEVMAAATTKTAVAAVATAAATTQQRR